jgi:hypothetical protein
LLIIIAPLSAGHETGEANGALEDVELAAELVEAELGVVDDTAGWLEDGLPDCRLAPQTFALLVGAPRPLLR